MAVLVKYDTETVDPYKEQEMEPRERWLHILLRAIAILLTECLCIAYRVHNLGDFYQVHIPNLCGLENKTIKPM
jgi:hypothetical protein